MSYSDLLKHANNGDASAFTTEFESMMGDKVSAALETRSTEVATSMYAADTQEIGTETDEDV
ncbi:MAG: hypothetical protein COA84_13240 [Robiginitomaculum sp.]|nr:MAG: hypothetical protein COA84_13240 [Robiginitomaculum sp.]